MRLGPFPPRTEHRPDPVFECPCTCGTVIAGLGPNHIDRLWREHLAEQRNPDDHELEAW